MNTKVNEGKLISGKDALIALASGEEVEFKDSVDKWENIKHHMNLDLSMFLNTPDWMKFRLKPRTITINGIEVPAPFKPKCSDMVWCLSELTQFGYEARTAYEPDDFFANIAYWRTEEEIKQVVAALRQVFGGSHDN